MSIKYFGLALAGFALLVGSTPADAQTQVSVASTSKQIIDNLPFFVAQETGILKKHGLVLKMTHFRGGGEVVRAVSTAVADIGMVSTSAAIVAIARGEPLKVISAWTAPAYGIVWITPANSKVKTIADLAGKKVGVSRPASVSHTGLLAALKANGLIDKVQVVPVGGPGDSWAALTSNRVQATWHTAPDVYSLINSGKARLLFRISEYLTDYQQGSLIATKDTIAKKGATVKKFLAAMEEAGRYIEEHPDEAAAINTKITEVDSKAAKQVLEDAPDGFFKIGAPTRENIAGSMAEAVATGALQKEPSYDALVDLSLLP